MTTTTPPQTHDDLGRRRFTTTDLALIASFAALISACAYVGSIPVGGAAVPITLQTFGILLAGFVLGPVRGFLAASLYLVLGAVGLPVFAEHSAGLGAFTGIAWGYLWSFPFIALLAGLLVVVASRAAGPTRAFVVFLCGLPAVLLNHGLGITGMKLHEDVSWTTAAGWDAPFWVGDLFKLAVAALIAAEVHRAFPALLRRR
ncbi:biotin transporter BioY [Nocardioides sp. KIGAM211]|uniref:Biotin transporter n=1 Tax=Nocardioides luti TaxID=2761101 RepID=A0A7X0V9H2_9ACTN|nr:biotin transporter BioY [Nocardioides luti]MBB6626621.1 biotin transporter BioY [Nocardioides luti]